MSTRNVESLVNRTTMQGSGPVQTAGRIQASIGDYTGIHPAPGSEGEPVTNKGGKLLNTFGADIPDNTIQGNEAEYTQVYEYTTPGGHSIEYNDTSGSERIMIRHANGTGVNIGPDGSVIISSKRRVDVVNENYGLSVTGDGKMTYQGNLTLEVAGDFNVKVGGEFNVTSSKKQEVVNGPYYERINGNFNTVVNGNHSSTFTGGGLIQYNEGMRTIVGGDVGLSVEGNLNIHNSGVLMMTSQEEVIITSPEANIAADNLSVFGDEGTIGGENIIMYNYNMYTGHSITATDTVTTTTFYGTLEGKSRFAAAADQAGSAPTGPGSGGGSMTIVGVDDTETALPTASLLQQYRVNGSKGVRNVKVDPDNTIKNNIDLSGKTGGVTDRPLTAAEVRTKMRDKAHRENSEFVSLMQSQGKLSPEYTKTTPPNISTVVDTSSIVVQGQTPMGSPTPTLTSKRIRAI